MMTYRWGVIGPGNIAQTFADALNVLPQGELYAVASRNAQRGQDFVLKNGAKVLHSSYQALIDDPKVDLVYIATPHSHHYPVARAVLAAGKHLLLEKPLTVNAAQTRELVKLAEQNNCVFQEALWSRFMPCFAKVKAWIEQGRIGKLQYITSQIGFVFNGEPSHRLLNPALAGGSLLDLGVYSVSISQYLLGEHPVGVSALATPVGEKVDHNTFVTLQYDSGVVSQFVSTIDAHCSNVMTIHGNKGYIHVRGRFWEGNACSLFVDGAPIADPIGKPVETQQFSHQANGFEYQIAATMQLIGGSTLSDERMSHADSIGVMDTLDRIRYALGLHYSNEIEAL
ncbi:Gfo/Idh/MocA family oxidoreductase [Aestuariibacter sp. GS-14]|nr:Gfo/Idh/MocA family oxidoreductase [Aestuariibacter sp. GS-14]